MKPADNDKNASAKPEPSPIQPVPLDIRKQEIRRQDRPAGLILK